jgi:uncharacterized protein (DUF885 family)
VLFQRDPQIPLRVRDFFGPVILALLIGGCRMSQPKTMAGGTGSTVASQTLAAAAAEYWEKRLQGDPIEATLLGDRRFDDRMPDPSPEEDRHETVRLRALAHRVRGIDSKRLLDVDRVTHAALLGEIENDIAVRACAISDWTVDPRDGPQVQFQNLAHLQTVTTPEQGRALVARWQKMPAYLDGRIANLRRALAEGRVATRGSVERVVRQLDEMLATPAEGWVLMDPGRAEHPAWNDSDRRALREGVAAAVSSGIRAAFERYRALLRNEILPRSRDDDHVGLVHVPRGAECYSSLIKVHTSLDLGPEEIHRIGLEENARIRAEMTALGKRLFGTEDLTEVQRRLRSDPALFFKTRDEVETKAKEALARADAAMPRWFGRLPKTPCVVKRVEAFEEKDTTIAYYRQPAVDGSRPGTHYINTFAPDTRPRYEAEVLAFHESIPGHHTQIAIAQEMTGIPEFRKHIGVTAYVEGWALYTERLAREMGLYSGDLDLMGMLSFDAWRASRLVVDTGLHAMGWSSRMAIRYMIENTALAENNIEIEVDRYIGWPGQALAYKLGQLEILALRREAEGRLGPAFDVRSFHDFVLGQGAVGLAVLREEMQRWIALSTAHAPKR